MMKVAHLFTNPIVVNSKEVNYRVFGAKLYIRSFFFFGDFCKAKIGRDEVFALSEKKVPYVRCCLCIEG